MRISDQERRLRIVERHHHGRTASGPEEVVRSVAALHSTDPPSPYISTWARLPGFSLGDLERSLYEDRSLVRMHTIRRTLFVLDRDDAVWFEAGATRDIARKERARLAQWLAAVMPGDRIPGHLERLTSGVLEALSGRQMTTKELAPLVPGLTDEIEVGSGKWAARVPVSSRLLFILAMDGLIVRASPVGTWRSSQYRWAVAEEWFGDRRANLTEPEGRVGVLRRYLETHGPATMNDIKWWTGWTVGNTREALAGADTEKVELEDFGVGFVVSGDTGGGSGGGGIVAFLPSLDSSTMGWKERDWYLGPHGSEVFDNIGNAGPTVWVDGRIVGGWGQRLDGNVVYELLEEVPRKVATRIREEAASLTDWLGDRVVMPRFPSPLGRRISEHYPH